MKVVIDGHRRGVVVEGADDLNGLSVVLRGTDRAGAERLLGSLGRLDGEYAWLDMATLHGLAAGATDPDWDARFAAAMAYAEGHGWTDGAYVRAHLEPDR